MTHCHGVFHTTHNDVSSPYLMQTLKRRRRGGSDHAADLIRATTEIVAMTRQKINPKSLNRRFVLASLSWRCPQLREAYSCYPNQYGLTCPAGD